MDAFLKDLIYYFDVGGYVMLALAFLTLLLWFSLGYRLSAVRRGSPKSVRNLAEYYLQRTNSQSNNTSSLVKGSKPSGLIPEAVWIGVQLKSRHSRHLRHHLNDAFSVYPMRMRRYSVLIKTIVASAPLLGLLGTVTGMIETFDALTDMALFSQSGGIAGGISQAMLTTQLGLIVAIPGLLCSRYIDRKEQVINIELAQLKDILCSADYDDPNYFNRK